MQDHVAEVLDLSSTHPEETALQVAKLLQPFLSLCYTCTSSGLAWPQRAIGTTQSGTQAVLQRGPDSPPARMPAG